MYDLGTELGQLRPDVGLRDQHARANRPKTGQRSERGHDRWCRRPLQVPDPFGDLALELLDPVVASHQPLVVRHHSPLIGHANPGRASYAIVHNRDEVGLRPSQRAVDRDPEVFSVP
jgi:hypothetical protein